MSWHHHQSLCAWSSTPLEHRGGGRRSSDEDSRIEAPYIGGEDVGSSTQDDPCRSNIGGRDPCNPCGVHAYGCVADLRRCLPTTSVTGVENVNRGQIGACPNTPHAQTALPAGEIRGPSKTRGSLSPRESTHQTASRSVHPLLQDSYACDQQTDRQTTLHV